MVKKLIFGDLGYFHAYYLTNVRPFSKRQQIHRKISQMNR